VGNISILTAFSAGLASFVSPCVLPLIPAYLSFISGLSLEQMQQAANRKKVMLSVLFNTIVFCLGFSVVFVALGASATFVGKFLQSHMKIFSIIAGGIIVILALHLIGIFRIKFLTFEKKIQVQEKRLGFIGSFFIGFAFAFGWTPCIGPILAGILGYAATQNSMQAGIVLLSSYSAGLAIPFILAGLSVNTFLSAFKKIKKYYRPIEIVCGLILIFVGGLIVYQAFSGASTMTEVTFTEMNSDVKVPLSSMTGKPVLLNFFASWCEPCKRELPELIEIAKKYQDKGILFVGIDVDEDMLAAINYLSTITFPYKIYHGRVCDLIAFQERAALPKNILLDSKGRKILSISGFREEQKILLINKLDRLAAK